MSEHEFRANVVPMDYNQPTIDRTDGLRDALSRMKNLRAGRAPVMPHAEGITPSREAREEARRMVDRPTLSFADRARAAVGVEPFVEDESQIIDVEILGEEPIV